MAHRANRVTDFMGDAGGQPAQCSEFRLLNFFRQHAGVFEENQHRVAAAFPQRRELGVDHAVSIGGDKRRLRLAEFFRVPPPGF